ncbi:hypothetical protein GCM10023093_01430 [Nemorincola caseinilytica]|uniref:HTH tetR-type domain-containing protein n=1 Tax=Nemorincola caseinilytica TaxID=2054315 RepID=A0ABP8N5E7_9BACT
MAAKKENKAVEKNASTEEKIKDAAKRVFTQKGYAATRTRDIAEESGYNLSLINYYFRSKEKLFDIIMMEQLQMFIHSVTDLLDDHNTTLQEKITQIVAHYIDMLKKNPGVPFFVMNEVNTAPEKLVARIKLQRNDLYIVKQWMEFVKSRPQTALNPAHIFLNLLGMTVFPFVAAPMISLRLGLDQQQFDALMDERKKLIPMWVAEMMN